MNGQYQITINLEVNLENVDEDQVRELVKEYLVELINDDSLDFEFKKL
jgi:hypothetical protein